MKKTMLRALVGTLALTSTIGILPAQTTAPTTLPAATEPTYNAPPSTAPTTQAALPKDLTTAIQNGIDLLKAGKNKEALLALVDPDDITKANSDGSFDKMIADFVARGHAKGLLASLQNALVQAPQNVGADSVSFAPFADNPPLIFHLIKNGWYIR